MGPAKMLEDLVSTLELPCFINVYNFTTFPADTMAVLLSVTLFRSHFNFVSIIVK